MNLQYIHDNHGNATGVFIPIEEWQSLKKKYDGLQQEELKSLMKNTGFGHVDYHNMSGGVVALHVGIKC